ncbi:MAG TPA: PIN domain-containing protein [Pyrinomonadaceae bacterium]
MAIRKVTFDTNVFVDYDAAYFPAGFLMSAVVMQELAAGALDTSRLKELEIARRRYLKEGRLLVPDSEDWLQAGKILNSMYRGTATNNRGRRVKIDRETQRRILRDVLIARTALMAKATVVTADVSDFEMIQAYCSVRVEAAANFFA